MNLLEISKEIHFKIKQLEKGREQLKQAGIDKANAIAAYEKALAITIIKLKNGVEFDFEGEIVQGPSVTLTEKISRGICYLEKLKAEETEAIYKSIIVKMNCLQSEINALQSIYRHSDSI